MQYNTLVMESYVVYTNDHGLRYIVLNQVSNDKGSNATIKLYENDEMYVDLYSKVKDFEDNRVYSFEDAMNMLENWVN